MKVQRVFIAATCLCVAVLVLFPALSWPAGGEKGSGKRANSLEPGSWSLQFQISDDFTIHPFNGSIISVKRHWSDKTALRLGLVLDFDNADTGVDQTSAIDDTLTNATADSYDSNAQAVQLNVLYLRYPNAGDNVNLFFGAGPLVRFSRSETEEDRTYEQLTSSMVVRRHNYGWSRTWAFGAIGVAGVEWFATKWISFHGEYRVSVDYSTSSNESESVLYEDPIRIIRSEGGTDSWSFNGSTVTGGISLYF